MKSIKQNITKNNILAWRTRPLNKDLLPSIWKRDIDEEQQKKIERLVYESRKKIEKNVEELEQFNKEIELTKRLEQEEIEFYRARADSSSELTRQVVTLSCVSAGLGTACLASVPLKFMFLTVLKLFF